MTSAYSSRDREPGQVPDQPPRLRGVGDEDPPLPSSVVLNRYNARVLDPADAPLLPGQRVRPTAYIADRLLVQDQVFRDERSRGFLDAAAGEMGYTLEAEQLRPQRDEDPDGLLTPPGVRLRIVPEGFRPASVDAWRVLQNARGRAGRDGLRGVGLDHLMFATAGLFASPYDSPNPYNPSNAPGPWSPVTQYGQPGYGGTQPVSLVLAKPRTHKLTCRRPVVAVVDTVVLDHPWLPDAVKDDLRLPGAGGALEQLGHHEYQPASNGDGIGPLDGMLDPFAFHATFIAGLIRQVCPDAEIVPVPVVRPDGVIVESELMAALGQVHELASRHAAGRPYGYPIDVVSLSLGYYHESADDAAFDSIMYGALQKLGRLGIAVVASAGNDATVRPMYPAAFTPNPAGPITEPEKDCVPVVGVGALNPNGTVALFSNSGPSASAWAPGAVVISTMPPSFNAGLNATSSTVDPTGRRRETPDLDNFTGGFGVGSGTSYAAPVFAGTVAQTLIYQWYNGGISLDATGEQAVDRGRRAVDALVKW
jgi:hypothetical protein